MVNSRDILHDMYNAVSGICDKVFLLDRPSSTSDDLKSFIVVSLPSAIRNNEMDDAGESNDFSTTAWFEVYVRDKVSSKNINAVDINTLSEKVQKVKALFPINAEHCVIFDPYELMTDSDGKQFHLTYIRAKIRTK